MGVFPPLSTYEANTSGFPHARGGVSTYRTAQHVIADVFPTPVGVFPMRQLRIESFKGFPHARGGVSIVR